MIARIKIDGGCAPKNPGHAGIAVVVKLDGKTHILNRYIGITTNNVAEYTALIVAVKYAKQLGATSVSIQSDSAVIVNQINGTYRTKSPEMRTLHFEAKDLLTRSFPMAWEVTWIGRKQNQTADHYCTLAVNHGRNLNPLLKNKLPEQIHDPFNNVAAAAPQLTLMALAGKRKGQRNKRNTSAIRIRSK